MSIVAAAALHRVSPPTAAKWLSRYKAQGEAGLIDRSSRPHVMRAPTPDEVLRRIEELRRSRMTMDRIASLVGVSSATVSRALKRAGLSRLADLDPEPEPVVRYEREHPGELLHFDTKKLARIVRPGHRVTGNPRDSFDGAGFEAAHIAIDDHSRVSFARLYRDESRESAIAFLHAALAYYRSLGVTVTRLLTDNGPAYRSKAFAKACQALGIKHKFTRPYTPKTNGKAERFIQSALREWAYGFVYPDSQARASMLQRWLHHYNWHRPHSALNYKPPMSRLDLSNKNLLLCHT
jgi:transposase InsO family protein